MERRDPSLDGRVLLAVQARTHRTVAVRAARATSLLGEHAAAWLVVSAAAAALDADRRHVWVRVGTATLAAHAAAVVLKRVVRRPRPALDGLIVHGGTASDLSFPSAHATSTTAFAVAAAPLTGRGILVLPAVMAGARLAVGVHYPSDVLVGAALGALLARWVRSAS